MGQSIEVRTETFGDVAVFDTDRTLTGQDGESFPSASSGSFAADLASRLFDADDAVDHVYVQFNVVSVRRRGGWDDEALQRAADAIRTLFAVY